MSRSPISKCIDMLILLPDVRTVSVRCRRRRHRVAVSQSQSTDPVEHLMNSEPGIFEFRNARLQSPLFDDVQIEFRLQSGRGRPLLGQLQYKSVISALRQWSSQIERSVVHGLVPATVTSYEAARKVQGRRAGNWSRMCTVANDVLAACGAEASTDSTSHTIL